MNHLTETELNEYLDEMLDESSRISVEKHLTVCEHCRSKLSEIETLFSTLADLTDMPLTRDLRPGVLARLPKPKEPQIPGLWQQPIFVVQSMLTILLLALSMPMLRTLVLQVAVWWSEISLRRMNFPALAEMVTHLNPLLTWRYHFSFDLPGLSLTMPTLPNLPYSLDINIVLLLVISAGLLWIFGNFSLLRNKPEVRE